MPAQPLELILGRQFIDTISLPAFLVDTEGNLLFYNESAETVFGLKFGETGGMRVEEWATIFTPYNEKGELISPEGLPLCKHFKRENRLLVASLLRICRGMMNIFKSQHFQLSQDLTAF